MLSLKRYFSALAVVLTMLTAYALGVAPWLVPPPIVRKSPMAPRGPVLPSAETQHDLERLFSPGSWERDNPKIVETDGCTLLVKDYKPTPEGTLELTPCTVIFYTAPEGDPQRRPIVLQAAQGAIIQFDQPLNLALAKFGKLVAGKLPGEIVIFSPETSPGAGDALHLTTRDIRIEKRRVFTPSDVDFRFGESHGRGNELEIALLPKDPEDANSGIGGIRSLTLRRIDRLHVETDAAGGKTGLAGLPGGSTGPAAPLEITCQGPFVFDVLAKTALFDEGVVVQRVNLQGPPDTLRCRQLLLVFADEEGVAKPASSTKAATGDQKGDALAGRLKRLIAVGSPVVLEAPSAATFASAARIEYSLTRRRLVLVPGQGAAQVSLKQGASEFIARELEYEQGEPGRLGRVWAGGPGQLKFVQEGAGKARPLVAAVGGAFRQTITARWDKELRLRPHQQNHVLSLVENASIAVDPLGQFSANELHLWVREVPEEEPGVRGQGSGVRGRRSEVRSRKGERFTIVPDRLLASGGVTLDSPQLHVDTARLEAWFQNHPAKPQPLPPLAQSGAAPAVLASAKPSAVDLLPGRAGGQAIRPPSLQKFDLRGDLIQMQIMRQGSEMELEDLTIGGHVVLEETRTAEPGQQPIRMTGDSLELRGGVSGPGKINVRGQPAEIAGRGMSLLGAEIQLSRAENRLWIDGPGEARLPAQLASGERQLADGPKGPPMDDPRSLVPLGSEVHLVWRDGLNFDGQTAVVSGEVQARTATQVATSKTLSATLVERIDFAAPSGGGQTDLAKLQFDGGVFIESRGLDEAGQQISYEQMQVKNLLIERTAGTLHADGPGWVSTTRLAKAGLPGATASIPASPMQPTDSDPNAKINVYIDFQGAIVGNLASRQIEFQREVRTIYMPVTDWDQRVVVNRLEDLGDEGVIINSERLTVVEMTPPGQPRWIETYASGNAVVEGKTFTVEAPRIVYTSDKQMLTLEGDGRADAQLWYRTLPGQPTSHVAAQKWQYWLRTKLFEVQGIKTSDFQVPSGGPFKLPGGRR
ncbi:MAG: hypothetical protein WD872_17210 [Pirellulaceae bacterium]